MKVQIEFEISDKSYEILKLISQVRRAEFRDAEYESLEHFKESKYFNPKPNRLYSEKWFKTRNFCDLKDMEDLIAHELVDDGGDVDWYQTWYITEKGKSIIEKYK